MFIRRRFLFKTVENCVISNNFYNYTLSNLYKFIKHTDEKYARDLHNGINRYEGKQIYKFFTHSIYIDNFKQVENNIIIKKNTNIYLTISGIKDIVDIISLGIFKTKLLDINNSLFVLDKEVGCKNNNLMDDIIQFKTINSVVTTTKDENGKTRYIPIANNSKYFTNIYNNLLKKYKTLYNEDFKGNFGFSFLESKGVKSEAIYIKKTKEVGYKFFFNIQCDDIKMKELMYYCGIGQRNAYGFGFLDIY